jgi:hypothetical protein
MRVHLFLFRSLACPHCNAAYPEVVALAAERPWLKLDDLPLNDHMENIRRYIAMAQEVGVRASSVPAFFFCGEMMVGWGEGAREELSRRVDACHQRLQGDAASTAQPPSPSP